MRTKQTARSVPVSRNDLVETMRAEMHGDPAPTAGSAAADAIMGSSIDALLSLQPQVDTMQESDLSDTDDEDTTAALCARVLKLLIKDSEKKSKKDSFETMFAEKNDRLMQLVGRRAFIKDKTRRGGDEGVRLIESKISEDQDENQRICK